MVKLLQAAIAATVLCSSSVNAQQTQQTRSPTLDDLTDVYDLGGLANGLAISPDGRRAAVFRRATRLQANDYQYELIVVELAAPYGSRIVGDGGGWIHRPGRRSGTAMDRVPVWSSDGASLAYLAERNGNVELWISRADGRRRRALVDGPGDIARFAFSEDGRDLVYEMGAPRAVLRQETQHQSMRGFAVDDRFEAAFGLRPRDRRLEPDSHWAINISTGAIRRATDAEIQSLDRPAAAVRGNLSRLRTEGDPAQTPVRTFSASANSSENACTLALCSGAIEWAYRRGSAIMFSRMEDPAASFSAIYRWDIAANEARLLRREEDRLLDCQMSAHHIVCMQESVLQPRRIVGIDIDTGAMSPIYDPNPHWRQFRFTPFERIDVRDAYGNDAFAHLFFPENYVAGRQYPLVIVQYRSRGFLRGGTGGEYPIHELARRGYFVLSVDKPDWRALASEQTARDISQRTELDHSERDMKLSVLSTLISTLDRRGLIDPHRIALTGLSDGAETLYWSITHSDLFAVAVASTPPMDATAWYVGSERFRRQRRAEYGDVSPWAEGEWGRYWRDVSPFNNADRVRIPLMMQLADAEALPAFPLYSRLRAAELPIEFYVYPDEYHIKWQPLHLRIAQERALDWIDFWLQGIERSDPREPDRLERWRAMRAARDASRHAAAGIASE